MNQEADIIEEKYPFSKVENYVHFSEGILENAYILDENWIFEDANFAFDDRESRLLTTHNGIEFLKFSGIGQSSRNIILRGTTVFFCKERHLIPTSWTDDLSTSEKYLIIPDKHYLRIPFRKIIPTLKQMYGQRLWISLSPEWVTITQGKEINTALMQFYLRSLQRNEQ